jgi:hypothetical protein
MKKEKNKSVKSTAGITGSAQYMRNLVSEGVAKADAFKKMLAKWPRFEQDKPGLESRWKMAKRIIESKRVAEVLAKSKKSALAAA